MKQDSTIGGSVQQVTWESLESYVRGKVQQFVQEVLEAEVTQLLGRGKCQRRAAVDAEPGYRNGYGKPRRLTLGSGTIRVRRPRVRGLQERFESRVLPLFARRTKEVNELLPELYLHGLAEGDFDLALRGLLGEQAPLSASTVARLKGKWQAEMAAWQSRRLDDLEWASATSRSRRTCCARSPTPRAWSRPGARKRPSSVGAKSRAMSRRRP